MNNSAVIIYRDKKFWLRFYLVARWSHQKSQIWHQTADPCSLMQHFYWRIARPFALSTTLPLQEDGRVTVHSFSERDPIPTFLKKVPVSLTYAFCAPPSAAGGGGGDNQDLIVFSDPTHLEERVGGKGVGYCVWVCVSSFLLIPYKIKDNLINN